MVYTKNNEVIFSTHFIQNGSYKFLANVDKKSYTSSFDLNVHLNPQQSNNSSPVEIMAMDTFASDAMKMIMALNNYLEEKQTVNNASETRLST
ncbi:unnamed protein product, partial [Rotaria sp. Silwood2]